MVIRAIYIVDFNGDGLKDLFVLSDDKYDLFYNHGGSKGYSFSDSHKSSGVSVKASNSIRAMGDFNGDGLLLMKGGWNGD